MALQRDINKYIDKVDKSVQHYKELSDSDGFSDSPDSSDSPNSSLYSEGDNVCKEHSEYCTFDQQDLIIGLLDKVLYRLEVIEGMIKDRR